MITYKVTVDAKGGGTSNPSFPWIDTEIYLNVGDRLIVSASGSASSYPGGGIFSGPDGNNNVHSRLPLIDGLTRNALIACIHDGDAPGTLNSGSYIHSGGDTFQVGSSYDDTSSSSGKLFLAINDTRINLPGWYLDNSGQFIAQIQIERVGCEQEDDDCDLGTHAQNDSATGTPISYRTGEKREKVTELSVNTPAGEMAFTRAYRQYKLTGDSGNFPQRMGLGWSHNHNIWLHDDISNSNEIYVYMSSGGRAHFEYSDTDLYVAKAGGTSQITIDSNSSTAMYTLDATNQTYVFDTNGYLRTRTWSNGEMWTYSYTAIEIDVNTTIYLLNGVVDSYGRGLKFSYYDVSSQFDYLQLWRIGDHDASGLDTVSPSGRYVEYSYVEEKLGGSIISDNPLLHTVKDVLGETWTYVWYGQGANETDSNQLNWLVEYQSPSVDTDGDGTDNNSLILKRLSYDLNGSTLEGITEEMGIDSSTLLTTEFVFPTESNNFTTETTNGKTITHYFSGENYAGVEDPAGNGSYRSIDSNYRTNGQQDANGNVTEMTWSNITGNKGKTLTSVKDANGNKTKFTYDNLFRLITSKDADDRKTNYIYEGDQRQPTLILSGSDVTEMDLFSTTNEADDWDDVNTPTTNERIPHAYYGEAMRYVDAASADGIESTEWELTNNENYTLTAHVFVVSGTVKMQPSDDTSTNTSSTTTGSWETLTINYEPYSGTTVANCTLQFIADGGAAEFYVDHVSILNEDVETLLDGGVDSNWSAVTSATHSRMIGAESGDYARRVVADAVDDGIENDTAFDLVTNHTYLAMARVYVVSGTLKMSINGVSSVETPPSSTGAWQTLRLVTTNPSATGTTLQFIAGSGAAEFYVDQVHLVDLSNYTDLALVVWQEYIIDRRGRTVSDATLDVTTGNLIRAAERTYDETNGLLESMTQIDPQDVSNNTTMTYTYDSVGRVVKTHRSSLLGTCQFSYTVYDNAGNVEATVCGRQNTTPPTTVLAAEAMYDANDSVKKYNNVTTHSYDTMGRRVTTTTHAGNTAQKKTTRVLYDALSRVTMQIANYVNPGADDDPPNPTYDAPGGWTFDASINKWKDTSDTLISHGDDNNKNIISRTEYNARGLVKLTQDHLGNITFYVYDDADRLVKTIQNAKDSATVDLNDGDTGYLAINDPRSSSYGDSPDVDRDIITYQAYDAVGNLVKTIDPAGRVTYTVYDALNRPVKVIANAKDTAAFLDESDPDYGTLDPRSDTYDISIEPDRDQVSITEYDALGRVIRTKRLLDKVDTTETWDVTLYGYDALGRQIKTIVHASVPDYDMSDTSLASYVGDPLETDSTDVDIITETFYNAEGQVSYTKDSLGHENHYAYDGLQRQTLSASNVNSAYTSIADWSWNGSEWQDGNGTDLHEDATDENIVAYTQYNVDSYVQFTRDVEGRETRFVYDELGRQIRTIQNYISNGETPADWVWDDTDTRWEESDGTAIDHGTNDDVNLISDTVYDDDGRVQSTRDHLGNVTLYGYDSANRRIKVVQNASNPSYDADSDLDLSAYAGLSPDADQDRISTTTYDVTGRVQSTIGADGHVSYFVYDELGRRIRTVQNYVVQGSTTPVDWLWDGTDERWEDGYGNEIIHTSDFDENLITETIYDKAGQVTSTHDVRGTQTAFSYDDSGRRVSVVQAANTDVASISYTCFDKAGRVLRTIANWIDDETDPDERDSNGDWAFNPTIHGSNNDQNLITAYEYDRASRRVKVTNPIGDENQTSYFKDGTVDTVTTPIDDTETVVTAYRYDGLRRRTRVVQNYVAQGATDPQDWLWDDSDKRWERAGDIEIHPVDINDKIINPDRNIIVDVSYDVLGRMQELRDPRGNVTRYAYDQLGRRTSLTNPLELTWTTTYANVGNVTQTTMTYPNISDNVNNDQVIRDFDRLGRLTQIDYGDPASTPTVQYSYDSSGYRTAMTEVGSSATVRETTYGYDELGRLTSVDFDGDGQGTSIETVEYEYNIAGNRTKLILPDDTEISYEYDDKGRLVKMTDFGNNVSTFAYDNVNRHIATMRQDGFRSHYQYDASGRLKRLRHHEGSITLADFLYEVDARGNRTKATELLRTSGASMATTVIAHDDTDIEYSGSWSAVSGFQETTQIGATLRFEFLGNTNVELTMGEGDDHSIYDVYVNETLWQSYDGYASVSGERVIDIPLTNDGVNVLEVRNTMDVNSGSSGRKVRFKQLSVDSDVTMQTITYEYDALSRLLEADYSNDRNYLYQYDLAGNRTQQQTTIGITTTTTNWTYNSANQMATMQIGANPIINMSFDNNGNLTDDGVLTYTWDSANRLKTLNNGSYNTHFAYDGNGDRHQQNVGGTITNYLLDVQPELALVLGETVGANTTSYVHAPMGVHSAYDGTDWIDMVHDGLGSVRSQVDATGAIVADQWYDPYGQVIDDNGTWVGSFGYAGEQTDESGLGYNRARYYNPAMGAFASLDPFEGYEDIPMSINGYTYAHDDPVNNTDPSGEFVNIIVGAIGGAVIGAAMGAILGVAQAEMTYYLAVSGRCKCSYQEQALQMGYTKFVQQFKEQGLIFGATFGAIFGAGGPLATVMGGVLSVLGIAQSAETVIGLFEDFIQDGRIDNECRWVDFAFDLLDIALGKALELRGGGKKGRKPQKPKNQNADNPPINRLPENSNSGSRVRTARRTGGEHPVSLRKQRKWYSDEKFYRHGSKREAIDAAEANKLELPTSGRGNRKEKWIASEGTISKNKKFGDATDAYEYRMEIQATEGTKAWLERNAVDEIAYRQAIEDGLDTVPGTDILVGDVIVLTKTNEPGWYGLTKKGLGLFNRNTNNISSTKIN